ncbi:MAG: PocR ligand-binding domain-containing protein [Clostridia bacterium]|nr:PocR ligand-binding domain-containing protein [Clostridia bacterium]
MELISKSILELAKAYALSTEVTVRIINKEGIVLHGFSNDESVCKICRHAQENDQKKCRETYIYGCSQAEKYGGKYVFFCHMGLTLWVCPIIEEDQLVGSIVAGPVIMMEPDDFILEDYLKKNNISGDFAQFKKDIKVVSPEKVDSYSTMLYYLMKNSNLDDIGEKQEIQDKISEHIHDIKFDEVRFKNDYPFDKEKQLLTYIKLADKQSSQKMLNEIFGHIFFKSGKNYDIIKARVLELIVVLSRAAIEGGADIEMIFGMNFKYIDEINHFNSVEDLTYWLSNIMAKFTEQVFDLQDVKHIDAIYKSIEYIKRNYMKKVTLDEVSHNSSLSPTYFSRIFKKEMNCSFNHYLNRVRIEMSKKLLLDEAIPLVDISIIVGFEDQSYYSKVFKKMTGITPGKYREKRGLFNS